MKHLDLFSGIGGFALAAEWVWGMEYENAGFCDIDPYCQQLLKLRFPGTKIYEDIRSIQNIGSVDLITGGFPCQPFSVAGKQEGKEDDRYLWPEMLRLIKECRPTWVIGENVAGIVKMALDDVLASLEAEGYAVRPFIIPACAVNAPHRRDRVWIIGYSEHNGELAAKKRRAVKREVEVTRKGRSKFANLRDQIAHGMLLPTARTNSSPGWDWNGSRTKKQPNLAAKIGMIPTPTGRDWKGGRKPETLKKKGRTKANSLGDTLNGQKTGLKLQPAFVEWMMGFPPNWTDLNCPNQGIERNALKPSETR